jgi:hypothetical protein
MQAKAFNALIATIDSLEQRICGEELPSEGKVDAPRLGEVILQAGRDYRASCRDQGQPGDYRLDLVETVRPITETEPGRDARLLSVRDAGLIQFTEDVFQYLESDCDLDPAANPTIQYLKVGMARTLLLEPESLQRPDHPLRLFCEYLVSFLKGYDAHAGGRAHALLGRIDAVIAAAVESPDSTEEGYEAARRQLIGLIDAYDQESLLFVKNLIAKEKGEASRSDARLTVNRAILSAVAGKQLPLVLLQFLQQVWSKYLYITYLREGMDSKAWRHGIADIEVLARGLTIEHGAELFRYYGTHLSKTLSRLRAGAASIYGDEALVERFFSIMDRFFVETMEGRAPQFDELVSVGGDDQGGASDSPALDTAKQRLVDGLRVGSWYLLSDKGLAQRCRLIERNKQYRYFLFTNLSAVKVAKQSYAQTALVLESGMLRSVDTSPVLERAMGSATGRLSEQIGRLQAQVREAERLRGEAKERRRQAELEQRLRRLQVERRREQIRLFQERRRLEQERARQAAEARQQAARLARDRALEQVLAGVERMQAGGSVELIGSDHQKIACKLGLKLKSTRKMIFVDRLGRKRAELLPEELAERIVDGSAAILDYGVAFDDTLRILIAERSGRIDGTE